MKRGTPDHPKAKMLQILMGLKRYEVVGILESIWHFAQQYAQRGDIGRWSDLQIATAIGWTESAEKLIGALVESGWLDRSTEYRLLIHDWQHHCDQGVERSAAVKRLGFAIDGDGKADYCPVEKTPAPPIPDNPKPARKTKPKQPATVIWSEEDGMFLVAQEQKEQWRKLYPTLDIDAEIGKASAWHAVNRRWKSAFGKALVAWFARSLDGKPRGTAIDFDQQRREESKRKAAAVFDAVAQELKA